MGGFCRRKARLPCSSPHKAAADIRPTYDVDAIAKIVVRRVADFSERLRKCGFTEDAGEGVPICRVTRQKKGDFGRHAARRGRSSDFPTDGTSRPLDSAVEHELGPDLRVRVIAGFYFCATKLEAFAGRGKGDYQSSRDLEDLIAVVGDGREGTKSKKFTCGLVMFAFTSPRKSRNCAATPSFSDALSG